MNRTSTAVLLISFLALAVPAGAEDETPAAAPKPTPEAAPRLPGAAFVGVNDQGAEEWFRARDGATIVRVPGGSFLRRPYEGWEAEEDPEPVEVTAFYVDKHEVTNARFAAFLNASAEEPATDEARPAYLNPDVPGLVRTEDGWRPAPGMAQMPVTAATGQGAQAFAAWVGGRLPQAAEWEKAASGPEGRMYPWGDERPDATRANFASPRGRGLMPVGSYAAGASPYGCLDMAGNAYERVYGRRAGGGRLPVILKGGAWVSANPLNLRPLDMCVQPMGGVDRSVGFRVVMDDPQPERASLQRSPRAALRLATDWDAARAEASRRRVPLLVGLFHETCGQSDRTREQLFHDPAFVAWCNEHAVVVVAHIPSHAEDRPHPPGPEGRCTLWEGLTCEQHVALYGPALAVVGGFDSSPGLFVLHPDHATKEARAKAVLVADRSIPKWGNPVATLLRALEQARERIGAAAADEK